MLLNLTCLPCVTHSMSLTRAFNVHLHHNKIFWKEMFQQECRQIDGCQACFLVACLVCPAVRFHSRCPEVLIYVLRINIEVYNLQQAGCMSTDLRKIYLLQCQMVSFL